MAATSRHYSGMVDPRGHGRPQSRIAEAQEWATERRAIWAEASRVYEAARLAALDAAGLVEDGLEIDIGQTPEETRRGRVCFAGTLFRTIGAAACFAIAKATNSDMLQRPRLRRLSDQPDQPCAPDPLRRRPGDGGDGARAVVCRPWHDGRAAPGDRQRLPPHLHPARRHGHLRRWKLRGTRSIEQAAYYRVSRATACSSAASTSA